MKKSLIVLIVLANVVGYAFASDFSQIEIGKGDYVVDNICQGKTGESVQQNFHDNGKALKVKAYCKDGKFNGIVKKYNAEGKILLKGEYQNGQLHGTLKMHDQTGKFLFRETYENGSKKGRYTYNEQGKLVPTK